MWDKLTDTLTNVAYAGVDVYKRQASASVTFSSSSRVFPQNGPPEAVRMSRRT